MVIILGIAKYDGPFESTSYTVAKYLAKDNDVYYVDYPYTWKDWLTKKDNAYLKRKPLFSSKSDGILPTNIERLKIIIVPPLLSINFLKESAFYRYLLSINEKIIACRIEKAIGKQSIKKAVYINSFNFHYPNLRKLLSPALSIYHCVDPLILWHDRKHGVISEKLLVKESDLVICTSRQLFEEKRRLNPATYFIPNAADLSHSSKAMDPSLVIHNKLRSIPKPIVGYFGNIERRIDYKLLSDVIKANTEMSFVFAGPVQESYVPEEFYTLQNVHFIGRIPYEDMPAVIKGFDVAIIPFKKDEVSNTIFPLKLFEYLGAGKPVVATDFNLDLKEFTMDEVQYCSSADDFSAAIGWSMDNDTEESRQRRIAIAAENSWDKRLSQFKLLIEQSFNENE
ncbi:MAG: glycosyltransferase [Pedobacter sp.]|nr:glycosyltransferase [Pedobacter sp.]